MLFIHREAGVKLATNQTPLQTIYMKQYLELCQRIVDEGVWIDNLDLVIIEDHCCISQGAYLCTGSHDWSRETFDLITKPIHIGKGAWLGAFSRVAPGTVIGAGAVLALGSTGQGNMEEWTIYQGVPAKAVRKRTISR